MNIFDELLASTEIPRFVPVHFEIERGTIMRDQIEGIIAGRIKERGLLSKLRPGDRVGIAASSRGINNYDRIVRSVVDTLKAAGAKPFIFPAMGSHGGATAEGQRDVLAGYGITAETMGVEILSSMETVHIGETPHGLPVHIDKNAYGADWIVPVGRVKPHTEFHGRHESGMFKMLTIGCGKQFGADICHSRGYAVMERNIVEIANVMLEKCSVLFGLAILEDAFHGTYKLEAIPAERFEEEDAALLEEAKALVPRIPFDKADVLILSEFGKNISGAGMDPNVTGRSGTVPPMSPYLDRICVLDMTDASHHNAAGIGIADVTTKRFFEKMSFVETYPNGITSHDLASLKIPPVMPDDRAAIRMAMHTIPGGKKDSELKIVWMKNTLSLDNFLISESLLPEALANPALKVDDARVTPEFDSNGNVCPEVMHYLSSH